MTARSRYFRDFVFSFDHGASKEERKFYAALKKKLPCKPSEALVIDDRLIF
jgi:FMN phosphatase YigB (HAD superfamily)